MFKGEWYWIADIDEKVKFYFEDFEIMFEWYILITSVLCDVRKNITIFEN